MFHVYLLPVYSRPMEKVSWKEHTQGNAGLME